jgi:hypothetical protein
MRSIFIKIIKAPLDIFASIFIQVLYIFLYFTKFILFFYKLLKLC